MRRQSSSALGTEKQARSPQRFLLPDEYNLKGFVHKTVKDGSKVYGDRRLGYRGLDDVH